MASTKKATNGADPFETMTAMSPEAFKEGYEKLAQNMSTFADFQKDSVEAVMASAGAFAKGFEKLASEQSAFIKASMEEGMASAKAASSSKSVQEAIDVNVSFVREAVEKNLG
ncbi:MAG: TIGR01841 family phasin, partial [Hyphococcus sp.]